MKAVVTGASRGIGEAIARALAHEGYELYLTCDRTFEILETVAEDIRSNEHVPVTCLKIDMSDERAVKSLFEQTGTVDLLVNNAGISYFGLVNEMSFEDWERIMAVNVSSVFLACREALKGMLHEHRGKIINISSIWGNTGASMEAAYSASKGAVNSFTRALAKETAPNGIQVNAIACGMIDTNMNSVLTSEELNAFVEEIPAGRMGDAKEVSRLAVLLSKAPDYLTGQIITLDGGYQ